MKLKRYKKVRKHLNFYCSHYGFHEPYQILIDGTFCHAALTDHLSVREQLQRYIGPEIKLLTTPCIIHETESLGAKAYGSMVIVKQFAIHHCGHEKHPISGAQCFLSMIGEKNTNRYIIATQDRDLQYKARKVPGTPLLYIDHKAPTLEPPSLTSVKVATNESLSRVNVGKSEEIRLNKLKKKLLGKPKDEEPKFKKKRKGPATRPKKKKPQPVVQEKGPEKTHKKKRRRIKLPKHVKEELAKQKDSS
nr:PREDICTED: rRNA-processing protein UTP23 homolog [Bemisia tabaci]